jgi:hypothetical protein
MSRRIILGCMIATAALAIATSDALGFEPLCDLAKSELQSLDRAIELRQASAGSLPSESEWFEVLIREHLLDASARNVDPWGRPFVYRRRGDTFDLFTVGPDGEADTSDDQIKSDRWRWSKCNSGCSRSGCTSL